jgi:hypothetical protein
MALIETLIIFNSLCLFSFSIILTIIIIFNFNNYYNKIKNLKTINKNLKTINKNLKNKNKEYNQNNETYKNYLMQLKNET